MTLYRPEYRISFREQRLGLPIRLGIIGSMPTACRKFWSTGLRCVSLTQVY